MALQKMSTLPPLHTLVLLVLLSVASLRGSDTVLMEKYKVDGLPTSWFGIGIAARNQSVFGNPKRPFLIHQVFLGSPADLAGVELLDEIIAIDGSDSFSYWDLAKALYGSDTGAPLTLLVKRFEGSKSRTLSIVLKTKIPLYKAINSKPAEQKFACWSNVLICEGSAYPDNRIFRNTHIKRPYPAISYGWKDSEIIIEKHPIEGITLQELKRGGKPVEKSVGTRQLMPKSTVILKSDGSFQIIDPAVGESKL